MKFVMPLTMVRIQMTMAILHVLCIGDLMSFTF